MIDHIFLSKQNCYVPICYPKKRGENQLTDRRYAKLRVKNDYQFLSPQVPYIVCFWPSLSSDPTSIIALLYVGCENHLPLYVKPSDGLLV